MAVHSPSDLVAPSFAVDFGARSTPSPSIRRFPTFCKSKRSSVPAFLQALLAASMKRSPHLDRRLLGHVSLTIEKKPMRKVQQVKVEPVVLQATRF